MPLKCRASSGSTARPISRSKASTIPGFTIAGASEGLAILALVVLLIVTPLDGRRFPFILVALAGMIAVQAVYWLVVHPVNRYWMARQSTGRLGREFFGTCKGNGQEQTEWVALRDRWERGHLLRAIAASVSLLSLTAWLVGVA